MPMSYALVPVAPILRDAQPLRAGQRANADFIAHLIATSAQAPQTRARRRAESEEALAAYGHSANGRQPAPAVKLSVR